MSEFIVATADDGRRYKLFPNGQWENIQVEIVQEGGFRSFAWGSPKAMVKARESLELLFEEESVIGYKGSVANLEAIIVYSFLDDALAMGWYSVTEPHADNNAYLSDFNNLKMLLTKKYGKPKEEPVYWLNDLFKEKYSDWGIAVSSGHVSFFVVWDDGETHLELQLYGDNYEVRHIVKYSSNKLAPLVIAKVEQDQLQNL